MPSRPAGDPLALTAANYGRMSARPVPPEIGCELWRSDETSDTGEFI
jgi:hypothetical protein